MIHLLSQLAEENGLPFFRVFGYITVRAGLALAVSFLFCIFMGPRLIEYLKKLQAIQYIRNSEGKDAISLAEMHAHKKSVPTMGGLLMLGGIVLAALLLGDWSQPVLWLAMMGTIGYCAIGYADDYLKVVKKNSAGLSAKAKLVAQILLGGVFAGLYVYVFPHLVHYQYMENGVSASITGPQFLLFPFLKTMLLPLGILYAAFVILVLTSTSNAVNLTDGLDGLAAGVTISATLCFAIVAYLAGRTDAASYLIIPNVAGAGELTVLLASLTGACLGFLWFNSHPAQVFMGDTGSMMLGGLLGSVALLIKQEFLLLIVGGVFVAETLSVILQVGSYKLRQKRIFRMAPLHHHFERAGVPESKIITRFWIVSALLAFAGLVTLKIR
ncbi:phospho-N-acetylmuramoyl-pentapeptide-transferase [Candidatus Sumerlaeota bacterium]|nr:phospho-N-acetylmuramoyl-pentapeptide-transferase [Candidatus Sumerlaeota bacterium]